MGLFYDSTYLLVILAALISMAVSARMNTIFGKYQTVRSYSGMTGREAAMRILHQAGIYDVTVRHISGKLTDAYNELQTYNVMLDSLISITQISSDVSSLARSSSSDLPETLDTQAGELAALQKLLDANSVSSLSEVSASLSENVSSIRSVMSSISSLYQDMDGDMPDFKKERPFHAQTVCKGPGPHQL